MKNNKQINELKKEMENLKKDFDKNYGNLEAKLKKLEKGDYEVGDIVNYCGFEWYIIEKDITYDFVTLMLKNKLDSNQLDMLGFSHNSYNDIHFSEDEEDNDWKHSNVKKCVDAFAENFLYGKDLMMMSSNCDEGQISIDRIRIPTLREIETLPKELREIRKTGYWLMNAAFGTTDDKHFAYMFVVNAYGDAGWDYVLNSRGVRPVIQVPIKVLN